MARRAKPGDILELVAEDGAVFVHYLGRHARYGDAIAVCPKKWSEPVDIGAHLFRTGYVTFYPVGAAVSRGFAKVVGHLPSPGVPSRLRRAGVRVGTRVETWIIEGGPEALVRRELTEDEKKLPIVMVRSHDSLLELIARGWRPEEYGTGTERAPEPEASPQQVREPGGPLLEHYLYFPRKHSAAMAAVELRGKGFEVEERRGADGVNWLVLARHRAVPPEESNSALREMMSDIALRCSGEYDGWELELPR